jgi:sterol desaturase/sphingolipid hydroxylase (fatty acid hydroxylase superfamily)
LAPLEGLTPLFEKVFAYFTSGDPLSLWLGAFLISGFLVGLFSGYFKARKIQPKGFRWRIFRNEIFFAVVNLMITGFLLGGLNKLLREHGFISVNSEPASWWVIAAEFTLYFFAFDTYFYWLHRGMHIEPFYTLIHKIHHRSISPNPLTTLSVSPLESVINGGFVPLFLSVMTVHDATLALILPTNIVMGLYVHSGVEFFPRWWNKTWATKWFITTTFHDQHHRYFKGNYGGYTTIWDWICGTVRPTFLADYEKVTTRPLKPWLPFGGKRKDEASAEA